MRVFQFIKKHKSTIWFSLGLNAFIPFLFLLLFTPSFETNDDICIMNMVNGFNGTHDPHLVFINYLIGVLLSGLYSLCGTIQWYVIFMYLVTYLSLSAITYVFMNRACTRLSMSLLITFLAFFGYEGYVLLQFTKVASFAACAGMLLTFWAAASRTKKLIPPLACGIALCVLSSMIRFSQALVIIGLMCTLGLCFLLCRKDFNNKKDYFRRLFTGIICVVIVAALSFGANIIDKSAYKTEEWQDYMTFNTARAELVDYGFPSYEANKDAINASGISQIGYDLFENWIHEDWDIFTTENTSELANMRSSKEITVTSIQNFWVEITARIGRIHTFVCFAIFAIMWFFTGKHSKPYLISIAFLCTAIIGFYAYMYFILDRYFVNRVDSGFWMAGCLCLMLFIDAEKRLFTKRNLSVITAFGVIFALFCGTHIYNLRFLYHGAPKSKETKAAYTEINADKEHIYFTTIDETSLGWSYIPKTVFETPSATYSTNVYGLGGWPARMPVYKDNIKNYGITNPIKDMVDNEKVYFVGENYAILLEFLKQHYNENIEIEFVKQMEGFPVYRFVTTD